jgi:hypothetical protein
MLAAQNIGNDGRNSAHHQAVGVDQMPFLLDLGRLCRLGRLHQRLHGLNLFSNEKSGSLEEPPSDPLFAADGEKVKKIRHIPGG